MRDALKLHYAVRAPNQNPLLPAGAVVNDARIRDLIRSAPPMPTGGLKVMAHGTIGRDLTAIWRTPPYNQIFSDGRRTRRLVSFLRKVELSAPLLEIIDYFKNQDPYTYRHILIVFALSVLLAQDFYEDNCDLQAMAQACTTHDLGKYCVPIPVLRKTSSLGQAERSYLEHHSGAGYVLLAYFFGDPGHPAAVTARDHHERCDGSGYPEGVCLNNRIVQFVAVCDVFDALISNRPYRPTAYDLRTALEELTLMADKGAFPWDIVKALINYNRRVRTPIRECVVSRTRRGNPPSGNLYRGVKTTLPHNCAKSQLP